MAIGNLTEKRVAATKAGAKAQKLEDGNGLRLVVQPTGSKQWILRHSVDGKRVEKGLGGWPTVSLAEARTKAAGVRAGVVSIHPVARIAAALPSLPTAKFEAVAREYYEDRKSTWKARAGAMNWIGRMENHVFPKIGNVDMAEFSSAHALAVLKPLWRTLPATAEKLRVDLESVITLALAKEVASAKASVAVKLAAQALGKMGKRKGHAAMALEAVPGFMVELADMDADPLLRLALAFVVLTAKRSGEIRNARKSWVRGDVLVFPAEVMKTAKPHREPLTPQALQILALAAQHNGDSEFIFPNMDTGKPYSDMAMLMLLRRNGHNATVHGFRATFRTWAEEATETPFVVMEMALAHVGQSDVVESYQRSELEAKRRKLMTAWANVVSVNEAALVHQLRIAA